MTFELSSEQQAARDRARAFAQERVSAVARAVDETAAIPADLLRELQDVAGVPGADATTLVLTTEELAAVSPAVAAAGALGQANAGSIDRDRPGLRGLAVPPSVDARARLVLAAVALGIGRAAIDTALSIIRDNPRSTHDQEKPHWVVADAATTVEAARVLVLQAAQAMDGNGEAGGPVAMAKLAAAIAANQAIEAALRVAGPEGFTRGTLLERLSRDVRAVALLMGTEEELRATAAQSLLPE